MKLKQKKSGIWMLEYTDEGGVRRRTSLGTRDKAAAETKAMRLVRGSGSGDSGRTVGDCLDHAWRLKWSRSKSEAKKEYLMESVRTDLGAVPLSDVDYDLLEGWYLQLTEAGYAVATIKSRMSCLRYALRLGARKGWLAAVPEAPEMGRCNTKLRYLADEPDEEAMLMAAIQHQPETYQQVVRDMITFLLETGCRLGELLKVRSGDLRDDGVVFHDRKGGDDLALPLTPSARVAIKRLLSSEYWMERVKGARTSARRHASAQSWCTHRFTEVRNAAGLTGVTLHTLRHTCATRLLDAGEDLRVVQDYLGHTQIAMTQRYTHVKPSRLSGAAKALAQRRTPRGLKVVE